MPKYQEASAIVGHNCRYKTAAELLSAFIAHGYMCQNITISDQGFDEKVSLSYAPSNHKRNEKIIAALRKVDFSGDWNWMRQRAMKDQSVTLVNIITKQDVAQANKSMPNGWDIDLDVQNHVLSLNTLKPQKRPYAIALNIDAPLAPFALDARDKEENLPGGILTLQQTYALSQADEALQGQQKAWQVFLSLLNSHADLA